MDSLKRGIKEFRKNVTDEDLKIYSELAVEQRPNTLFLACSDSRVVPNVFVSSSPGDLLVVRNIGNIVTPYDIQESSEAGLSESAAIEFAVQVLKVKNIIVCGHSECSAMKLVLNNDREAPSDALSKWVTRSAPKTEEIKGLKNSKNFSKVNLFAQKNALKQIENIKTYPSVQKSLSDGSLELHAWWFDIATASVYEYVPEKEEFQIIK